MLHITRNEAAAIAPTPTAPAPTSPKPPVRATGPNLKKLLHSASPRDRARIAAMLVTGQFTYVDPTVPQAARICRVAASRVHGWLGHSPKPPSDAKLDQIIVRLGPDRVLAALDRLTYPQWLEEQEAKAARGKPTDR